jgi:hypothetical protein
MRIPDDIQVVISAGGRAVPQMLAMMKFVTSQKNSFNCVFGPSNDSGYIRATRLEIVAESQKDRDFFPMDYGEIEFAWTGTLIVTPMNREALSRARSAFHSFRLYPYRANYEESLDAADAALTAIPDAELTVSVQCSPPEDIHVQTVAVIAT